MSDTVKFLGTTDEVDVCDCCGRNGLKSTVAISINDGEAVYYGVDCAARALGRSKKDVCTAARKAADDMRAAEQAKRDAEHRVFMSKWTAFLAAAAPSGHDVFTWIEALGGGKCAREFFNASTFA